VEWTGRRVRMLLVWWLGKSAALVVDLQANQGCPHFEWPLPDVEMQMGERSTRAGQSFCVCLCRRRLESLGSLKSQTLIERIRAA
jgi:hypothetical protein